MKKIAKITLSLSFLWLNHSASNQPGFFENKGQILGYDGSLQPSVKFVFLQGNTQLFLLDKGIAYQFTKTDYPEGFEDIIKDKSSKKDFQKLAELQKKVRTETFRMDMTLVGANTDVIITKEGKSLDFTNYYNRNALDVRSYDKITYHNIYPGIDWVIYSNNGAVKYDFVIRPGADPALIKMEFKHQEELTLNEDGSFTLKNLMGSITEKAPLSFQNQNKVATKFEMKENCISFILGDYNPNEQLTIDPSIIWATYYGSSGVDYGMWCATDLLGNVFLTGSTTSASNISSGGHQVIFGGASDAFLVKFNANGTRVWATYYGGTGGDPSFSCATDASGNIFIAGLTTSTSNVTSNGHQNAYGGGNFDAFLVKFNSNGVRQWGTYYGGSGDEIAYSCSTDNSGNIYITGNTTSTSHIASGGFQNTLNGIYDAFLIKFDGNGVRLWGTYYGGPNDDYGFSCVNDASGNVYLAGNTSSSSNIASFGHQNVYGGGPGDAFLVKFNANGVRLWATYYGGFATDNGYCCTTDVSGSVYLGGDANSATNIASAGHQNSYLGGLNDAYLVKFNSNGVRLWATYYGGASNESAFCCIADASNNIYVSGVTSSTSNIASLGYQNNIGGSDDAFLVKFDSNGLRLWGTYYGGVVSDLGHSCEVDPSGNIYLGGETSSPSGIASGGYQNTIGGSIDAFLVRFCDVAPGLTSSIAGNTVVCSISSQVYSISPVPGATSYSWSPPTAWSGSSTSNSIVLISGINGTLNVSAINACGTSSAPAISITVNPTPTLQITGISSICEGLSTTQFVNGSATSYTWSNGTNGNVATLTPSVTTIYTVTGTNAFGCKNFLTKTIIVNPLPNLIATSSSSITCLGETLLINVTGAINYTWSSGINGNQISVTPSITTSYSVIGADINACKNSTSLTQIVDPCTGISSISEGSNILVELYPNPNNGLLKVKLETNENINLCIYDIFGKKILDTLILQNSSSIDISNFASGIYLFVFRKKGEILKEVKVIKE